LIDTLLSPTSPTPPIPTCQRSLDTPKEKTVTKQQTTINLNRCVILTLSAISPPTNHAYQTSAKWDILVAPRSIRYTHRHRNLHRYFLLLPRSRSSSFSRSSISHSPDPLSVHPISIPSNPSNPTTRLAFLYFTLSRTARQDHQTALT
jgi:hypothetical protein